MNLLDLLNIEAQRKLHDRYDFQGLKISIENRAGSVRQGVDKNGKPWKVKMTFDYGYIRMTQGVDGDHVDCFIGPDKDSEKVYIIHRVDPNTGKYDEDKCMLGFASGKDAKSAFLANYDRPGNFGSMDEMSLDKFKEKVLATKDKPVKLAAGGPGSGRHKEVLYHGTTFSKAKSIVRSGLKLNRSGGQVIPHVTISKNEAKDYARTIATKSDKPVVIVLRPEASKFFDSGELGEGFGKSNSRISTKNNIHPKYIDRIEE